MNNQSKAYFDLIVIGGGAAGFFGALQAAEMNPHLRILILEKTTKLLTKVKVSGGGRCNVTHSCFDAVRLSKHYPRGEKRLGQMFRIFQAADVVKWFASKGVTLKTEGDGRMFPATDSSQTIIDCFMQEAIQKKIKIEMSAEVHKIAQLNQKFSVTCVNGKEYEAGKLLIAAGGNPNIRSYQWIQALGHKISTPIPSLFTFNDSKKEFADLMGLSVPNAEVRIAGTKYLQAGPVLITHWGLSGPAIIKLSAWAAEHLNKVGYNFTALVSWIGPVKEEPLRNILAGYRHQHGKQKVAGHSLFSLPHRLWLKLCTLAGIEEHKIWSELPQRNVNKLVEALIRCPFAIKGKTTFKEEFVTCGGVDLNEIHIEKMESKKIKNVYFAGEVLHIDGETGGFNFQAAWTTSYLAARAICDQGKGVEIL